MKENIQERNYYLWKKNFLESQSTWKQKTESLSKVIIKPLLSGTKIACLITRKYFNMYCNKPYNDLLVEIIGYIVPIRPNRRDKRNMKPKSAVWFVYRVA